jgi:hypothetical protein
MGLDDVKTLVEWKLYVHVPMSPCHHAHCLNSEVLAGGSKTHRGRFCIHRRA